MRLLVVDDDPNVVNILSFSMKESGYEVDEANDGTEAIDLLQHNSYDIAIIDAIMPKMKGAEVCKFIKTHYPNIYVIGISGYPDSLKKLKNEGADICFTKPFNIDQIKRAIKNHFRSPLPEA
ncbi:MAG TPA: response regulator [Syntrophales bacterium]|nr:response regulator [Syntrophales bacterium]